LVEFGDDEVRMKVFNLFLSNIEKVHDRKGSTLSQQLVKFGNTEMKIRIIGILGERIGDRTFIELLSSEDNVAIAKLIGTLNDKEGRNRVFRLAELGNDKIMGGIADAMGEKTEEIKDGKGCTLAHYLVAFGNEEVRAKVFKSVNINSDKESKKFDMAVTNLLIDRLHQHNEKAGDALINKFGKNIGKVLEENGASVAFSIVRYGSNKNRIGLISTVKKDIVEVKDGDGNSLAVKLAEKGDDTIRMEVIKLFKKRIPDDVAIQLVVSGDYIVKAETAKMVGKRGLERIKDSKGDTLKKKIVKLGNSYDRKVMAEISADNTREFDEKIIRTTDQLRL
jgi:hypothetical protein